MKIDDTRLSLAKYIYRFDGWVPFRESFTDSECTQKEVSVGVTNTPLQNLYKTCNSRRVTYGISRQYQMKPWVQGVTYFYVTMSVALFCVLKLFCNLSEIWSKSWKEDSGFGNSCNNGSERYLSSFICLIRCRGVACFWPAVSCF